MRKYVIMGAPGCGKGTQAKLLSNRYDLVHISVGDIFRLNIQNHTKLAARIKRIVNTGRLVPDDIVDEVVDQRLREHDWNYGFMLDGFPRNKPQAEFFLESYDIDAVVLLDVTDEAVIERVQARRLCSDCGLDYNLIHHRPAEPDVCDVCGGSLIARADDVEETVLKRLADYREQTVPVVDLFMTKELVVRIDGMKSIEQVNAAICNKLGLPPAEMLLA
ncbi:adenylate kinase [Posidoniimonas polymericola]|uniref:Adenylate kinase n=1 Tax=Posidoniimonas polymericola TaxID=2528002 RepID=A0A5C5YUB9_9BACT|nr:nucleoside monophosphate kinase [Posidoniimonas polymericola]TWT78574.1 adenylate kinase [Posidoniimonas polymericola]